MPSGSRRSARRAAALHALQHADDDAQHVPAGERVEDGPWLATLLREYQRYGLLAGARPPPLRAQPATAKTTTLSW